MARHEGEPLAAALVIIYCSTAHLRMMPSSRRHKELPARAVFCRVGSHSLGQSQGCAQFNLDGYTASLRGPAMRSGASTQFKRGFRAQAAGTQVRGGPRAHLLAPDRELGHGGERVAGVAPAHAGNRHAK